MKVTKHATEGLHSVPKWAEVIIGEISDVIAGGTPKAGESSNFAEPGTAVSWLTPADLSGYKEKYISYGRRDLSQQGYDSSSAKLMPKGSLLFSSRAPIGYVVIANNEISTNQGFKNFVFTKSVDSSYAYYYLSSIRGLAESLGTGTTFKEISGATAKKLPFLLPPLAEQKVIADKLDTMLAQVETTKARLDRIPQILKTFRQSVLAAAVSGKLTEEWQVENEAIRKFQKLGSAGVEVKTGPFGSALHKSDYLLDEIPVINPMHISDGRINPSASMTISEEKYNSLGAWHLKEGDVVVGRRGEMGRAAVYMGSDKMLCGTGSMILRPPANTISKYLEIILRSPTAVDYFNAASVGSTMVNLNQKVIKELEVYFPEKEEQTEIVRRVEELFAFAERIEQKANAALERVNNLTQSILAKAFRGELTADWRTQNPDLISGDNSAEALLEKIKAEREALSSKKKPKKKAVKKAK
ncbi:MAG: restriction endonuclease subunit S [Thiomicrorhabdus sp.]|nr:restriction endonuclease subunit S [Thiomicrorhabdus sp.]